jgi:amino acid adenylation domain-containing protein
MLATMLLHEILDAVPDKERPYMLCPTLWTYGASATASRKIANWLRCHGVKQGDRILIVAANCPEAVLTAFAASRLGAVFSLVDPAVKPHGLIKIVQQCRPAIMVLEQRTISLYEALGAEVPACVIGEALPEKGLPDICDALCTADSGPVMASRTDDAPVCLIYTSGSTGTPRGVILTHHNILFVTAAIQARLSYQADDTIALLLPMSFDYGLYQFFLAARAGASVAIGPEGAAGPEMVSFLRSNGATVLPGVPTLFANLIRLLDRRPQPLPQMRCLTNTGDYLPAAYIDRLREHIPGARVFPMYGLTECKRVSILLPEEIARKPRSVGRPLDGTEIRIVDEEGCVLPPDAVGELVVRGPHVADGYWEAPEETSDRFRFSEGGSRELYTGDLCSIDGDGFLYFMGRKDAQIKHRGYRLSPLEIEDAACDIRGVRQAGVVKDQASDMLCLYAVANIPPHDISTGLKEKLEHFKVPDQIILLDDLPKTANGKIDRRRLADQAVPLK